MEDGLVVDVFLAVDDEGFVFHFDGDDFHLDLAEGGEEEFELSFRGVEGSFTSDVFFAEGDNFVDEKITVKKTDCFFGMVLDELFL